MVWMSGCRTKASLKYLGAAMAVNAGLAIQSGNACANPPELPLQASLHYGVGTTPFPCDRARDIHSFDPGWANVKTVRVRVYSGASVIQQPPSVPPRRGRP